MNISSLHTWLWEERKISTEKPQFGSYRTIHMKYYVSGMCNCIQSLLHTTFSFTYYDFFLGMCLLIPSAGYLTMSENHKYFTSFFCHSCMLCICTHLYTHTHTHKIHLYRYFPCIKMTKYQNTILIKSAMPQTKAPTGVH